MSIVDNKIEVLNLEPDVVDFLHVNNINIVKDLWVLSRRDLKKMKLSDKNINHIEIKLQLKGLDLNKKVYGKLK